MTILGRMSEINFQFGNLVELVADLNQVADHLADARDKLLSISVAYRNAPSTTSDLALKIYAIQTDFDDIIQPLEGAIKDLSFTEKKTKKNK